jgi:hypothetical protein
MTTVKYFDRYTVDGLNNVRILMGEKIRDLDRS